MYFTFYFKKLFKDKIISYVELLMVVNNLNKSFLLPMHSNIKNSVNYVNLHFT